MITSTFCHIPGIGETTERNLWADGIAFWDSAPQQAPMRLPRRLRESWSHHMEDSIRNYEDRNASFFVDNLQNNHHWRLYDGFQDACAFVDIETTGLSCYDEITTAVLYDGQSVRHYVNGDNLGEFPDDLREFPLVVTYHGKCFDIPFIQRFFGVRLPRAIIDLEYPLRSLGLSGGLKGCERQLGISRNGLESVNGVVAVSLWNEYRRRQDLKALQTLLAYNVQDTISLHALVVHTHNEKIKATPFSTSHFLPSPSLPPLPFKPDHDTIERARVQSLRDVSIYRIKSI